MRFHGALTALITPFTDSGVDEAAFRTLVQRQLEAGIDGLVPCGTTGEAPTLDLDEHASVIRWTVEEAAGKVPVLAGIGSNDTRTAITNAKRARDHGADGLLATAPYYNKPTQEGLYRHFVAIAEAVPDAEVCVYNVPGRTSVHVEPSTIGRLSAVDNITCVKEATGDLIIATDVARAVRPGFGLLSGDDFTTLPFIAVGGHGCISVLSNLLPAEMVTLVRLAREGKLEEARALHQRLFPIMKAMFLQTNPLPVKTALSLLGLCDERFRLPLVPMDPKPRAKLVEALTVAGVLGAR